MRQIENVKIEQRERFGKYKNNFIVALCCVKTGSQNEKQLKHKFSLLMRTFQKKRKIREKFCYFKTIKPNTKLTLFIKIFAITRPKKKHGH